MTGGYVELGYIENVGEQRLMHRLASGMVYRPERGS